MEKKCLVVGWVGFVYGLVVDDGEKNHKEKEETKKGVSLFDIEIRLKGEASERVSLGTQ